MTLQQDKWSVMTALNIMPAGTVEADALQKMIGTDPSVTIRKGTSAGWVRRDGYNTPAVSVMIRENRSPVGWIHQKMQAGSFVLRVSGLIPSLYPIGISGKASIAGQSSGIMLHRACFT